MSECLGLCNIKVEIHPLSQSWAAFTVQKKKKNPKRFSLGKLLSPSHYKFITGLNISMAIISVNVFNLKFILEMAEWPFWLVLIYKHGVFFFLKISSFSYMLPEGTGLVVRGS